MKIAIAKDSNSGHFYTTKGCCPAMLSHYEDSGLIYLRPRDGEMCIKVATGSGSMVHSKPLPINYCPFCGAKIEVYKAQEAL